MSAEQQIALAVRKERLLVRIHQQREQIEVWGGRLRKPCALADKAIDAGYYVKAHPWTAGVAVGVAALVGRHHLFRMAGLAWSGWKVWRLLNSVAQQSGFMKRFINK